MRTVDSLSQPPLERRGEATLQDSGSGFGQLIASDDDRAGGIVVVRLPDSPALVHGLEYVTVMVRVPKASELFFMGM